MQTKSKIFDDFAKVAGGATSTVAGIRGEVEAVIRQQMERILGGEGMVSADEFEAVKAMAARARSGQEKLEKRVAALEARLGGKSRAKAAPKAKANPPAKPKPGAKKPAAKRKK